MSVSLLQKLAGLGALGVSVGLVALYALIVFLSLPGGIDRTESLIAVCSVGLLFVALIAPHIVYGRILLAASRGKHFGL
ncbi:MAG TPA: hypothetical protein VIC55_08770 [Gemmatimonadaceae bacterium]|jgi:hypothetical protein